MNKKKSDFDKVFSAWDILVIAFGAMIGWGWVVSTGGWIEKGGVVGAALGFAIGGVMIFFVGLTYAELTAAMPQCGGEHVFSHRACGDNSVATKRNLVEILRFRHFSRHVVFDAEGDKFRNKRIEDYITVSVVIDMECGNTKN